ncbi:hypothetical protein RB195_022467 [Necator americanus]|uniref:Uncharacterized protein n=1 Tax=Necator americanus TaxID=51031 RepID=A0ABR1EI05_NECAM
MKRFRTLVGSERYEAQCSCISCARSGTVEKAVGIDVEPLRTAAKNEQVTTRIGRLRTRGCGPTPPLIIFFACAPSSSYEKEEDKGSQLMISTPILARQELLKYLTLEPTAYKGMKRAEERRAEVLAEAAEADKSIGYARRDFASRKTKDGCTPEPEGNNHCMRKGSGENHPRFLLRSLRQPHSLASSPSEGR